MENTQALQAENAQALRRGKTNMKDPVVKTLIKVFWILLVVTLVEIGLALLHYSTAFPPRPILNAVFIGLTIVKAAYIVGEFMHLRHEMKHLIWIVLLPLIFLFWAIAAFLYEGSATKASRHNERQLFEATIPWEKTVHETH